MVTPAMVGANWARDWVFPSADVYFLNGRVSYDGKNVFPKDCMISHFHPQGGRLTAVWDWKSNVIEHEWERKKDK
jgi:predicted esterase